MVSADIIRTALGIGGNIIAFALFLSPAPTFAKICQWKSTQEYSPVPYITTLLNCLLWMFYGLPIVHPHALLVLTINTIGAVLEITYTSIFFIYAGKKGRVKVLKMLGVILSFFLAVVAATLLLAHTTERKIRIVGGVCVIVGTLMYASPLTIMRLVIQTKSVKYMPFNLILASFLNGLVWTAYATIKFDIFITIPNVLGSLLAGCQLLIYAIYYRNQEEEDHELPINVDELKQPIPKGTTLHYGVSPPL